MLSNHFGDELLPIILPIVQQRLQDADWKARESGMLKACPPSCSPAVHLLQPACLLPACLPACQG